MPSTEVRLPTAPLALSPEQLTGTGLLCGGRHVKELSPAEPHSPCRSVRARVDHGLMTGSGAMTGSRAKDGFGSSGAFGCIRKIGTLPAATAQCDYAAPRHKLSHARAHHFPVSGPNRAGGCSAPSEPPVAPPLGVVAPKHLVTTPRCQKHVVSVLCGLACFPGAHKSFTLAPGTALPLTISPLIMIRF